MSFIRVRNCNGLGDVLLNLDTVESINMVNLQDDNIYMLVYDVDFIPEYSDLQDKITECFDSEEKLKAAFDELNDLLCEQRETVIYTDLVEFFADSITYLNGTNLEGSNPKIVVVSDKDNIVGLRLIWDDNNFKEFSKAAFARFGKDISNIEDLIDFLPGNTTVFKINVDDTTIVFISAENSNINKVNKFVTTMRKFDIDYSVEAAHKIQMKHTGKKDNKGLRY